MLAVIGGSGWEVWSNLQVTSESALDTPYGKLQSPIQLGELHGVPIAFLSRHGSVHALAPHQINYRANIWALKQIGVEHILSINAVGGISPNMGPGTFALPDQLIDYTWGREHSFWSGDVLHVDFSNPFAGRLRNELYAIAQVEQLAVSDRGVYGCTQGPRLETAAEIARLKRDGCDFVGMTAMPEAVLARELALDYCSFCVSVNWAAGIGELPITMGAIFNILNESQPVIHRLIEQLCQTAWK